MSTIDFAPDQGPVGRRGLLRGAGLLAGAAGAAALLTSTPATAEAADGDRVLLGRTNDAASTTTVRIGDDLGTERATLSLRNASGPTLALEPRPDAFRGELEVGEIINQTTGPVIGVDNGDGPENTYVALGSDLAQIPTPFAFTPVRLLDTRRPPLSYVVGSSSNAFDADHRLVRGAWLDLGVLSTSETFSAQAVFVNVTVTHSQTGGYLTVCPPGPKPPTSIVNFGAGQTVDSAGFIAVGVVADYFAIRVYTSATAHVVVDVSGYTVVQQPGPQAAAKSKRAARITRTPLSATVARRGLTGSRNRGRAGR